MIGTVCPNIMLILWVDQNFSSLSILLKELRKLTRERRGDEKRGRERKERRKEKIIEEGRRGMESQTRELKGIYQEVDS